MSQVTPRPIYQKAGKAAKKPRQRMKARSGKAKAPKSATGPMVEPEYAAKVREMPCCGCKKLGPSEIHHCKDRPPANLEVYRYFPGYGEKSADYDGIPLCRECHHMYHNAKGEFRALYGRDYTYIPATRAEISFMEIGF